MQPDFGMTVVISSVWAAQVFLSGISMALVAVIAVLAIAGAIMAYLML
ncbi:cell division protein FtsW, partial [bacterium LRH843]|nr:cell division protein FtsW [bacterium LRH843]